jgi:DNA polymerase-3 subunit gamma/tau
MSAKRQANSEQRTSAEGYTVLARRYRPQQFRDLVGQEPVAQALTNALQSNRVAHAYLFTGARGVGKTSTARILAKALNCVQGPTATPCDTCEICQSIASGEDVDVLEIDGATNRRIDEVREIRGNVQYRPSRARFKIYIIDEVHMLTKEAFNALLKTLEEPPPHVKFIFATTEVEKIPITILSRCQRFDFAGIGTARIVERLRQVVAEEGVQADDDALERIARRAAGSMRDAQSLLDQLLAFGGDRLTTKEVHQLLGTAHDDRVAEMAAAVLEHDPKRALGLLAQAADEGLQLGELLDQFIAYWRDLMVVSCAGPQSRDLSMPDRYRETLSRQAAAVPLDSILAGLDILAATKSRLRTTAHGRVLVEMALVRLGRLDHLVSLAQLAQWLDQPTASDSGARRPAPPTQPTLAGLRAAEQVESPEAAKKKLVAAPEATPASSSLTLTSESLPQIWREVLAQVGRMHGAELERSGLPAISAPNALVLRFPVSYNSQREYCQEPAKVARVEDVLRKLTGRAWLLRVESAGGEPSVAAPPADNAENSSLRSRRQRAEVEQEPLIKAAIDLLEARVVHVDDGFGTVPAALSERTDAPEEEET